MREWESLKRTEKDEEKAGKSGAKGSNVGARVAEERGWRRNEGCQSESQEKEGMMLSKEKGKSLGETGKEGVLRETVRAERKGSESWLEG